MAPFSLFELQQSDHGQIQLQWLPLEKDNELKMDQLGWKDRHENGIVVCFCAFVRVAVNTP